ncbi:DSBA oxidoreductase [Actinoplanes sp. NBRC 14428]|uniref:Putative DsbA family dithiol-disulfide isomerase n=1 Tax=Pseudosporangium ferrugineum TaxID=439699 RepID=A0A2T0SID1_9ACTN|nr:DsbA family oxidoreductase [Pseudosporangium ferrugineum]PRY33170.1 putative DsbA family dithiol-disulfide isomerase [Pseudosporangium ferrugineum]BCJ48842.1 DSBA oxidoreductase [Actinoplanes sp. NBRC 14428]
MLVEIWSDIVCPWCYIGKRRLETALRSFEHADEVEIVWRSFQLDPGYPKGRFEPVYDALAKKFGGSRAQVKAMTAQVGALAAAEGLRYDFEHAVSFNTFDAHRLLHLAKAHGAGAEAHERLMRANLVEGATLDTATLVRLGTEVGVPAAEAQRVLDGDDYTGDVLADIEQAHRYGATGVPFFVLDRAYGVSGAQSADVFLQALRTAREAGVPAG